MASHHTGNMPKDVLAEKGYNRGRNVPALHSSLKQDHMLKGLPALRSLGLVGLEGGCEGGHQPDQDREPGRMFHSRLCKSVHGSCKSALCQRMTPQH